MTAFDEIRQLDAEHVMQTYGRLPVAFVRGEGVKLWDSEGNEYLDFLGGLAVTALGHSHPAVADAVADQARTLLHVSNLYYNEVQPRVAARLDALLGGGGRVFFANSGAEANECAIKLSRRYGQANGGPERYHVLSALGSFHGRTLTTLAATGQPQKQEMFQPLPPGFRQVSFGDLDALAAAMDERVCAVMLEPIQGEGGVLPSPPGYLEAVRALCDEREALLVIDEVASAFKPGDHATTYGGQPLAARAALTVLEVMEAVDAPACASHAGARLSAGLAATPGVSAVRGAGLILGAELEPPHEAPRVALALLHAGLVVNAVTPTALRFEPSLLVTDDEIDAAVAIVHKILEQDAGHQEQA